MSRQNSLANKAIRRAEREENAARQEKKRELQGRMAELFFAPEGLVAEEIPNDAEEVQEEEVV